MTLGMQMEVARMDADERAVLVKELEQLAHEIKLFDACEPHPPNLGMLFRECDSSMN